GEYEPGDLVRTVRAGTTLAELAEALAARGQRWPVEPGLPERATVGGTLASAAGGPSRMRYFHPRDWVIGARVVLGDATSVRSGGRVVKNVTGYDLTRFWSGTFGTLAAIVELTLKLTAVPERTVSLVAEVDVPAAFRVANELHASSLPLDALAVVTGEAVGAVGARADAALVVRLAGPAAAGRRLGREVRGRVLGRVVAKERGVRHAFRSASRRRSRSASIRAACSRRGGCPHDHRVRHDRARAVHPLWALSRSMSHVQDHAARDGIAARAPASHGCDRGPADRPEPERRHRAAPRSLPGVPRVRGGLPVGRAVRPPDRGNARRRRASARHLAARPAAALVRFAAVGPRRDERRAVDLRTDRPAPARASIPVAAPAAARRARATGGPSAVPARPGRVAAFLRRAAARVCDA